MAARESGAESYWFVGERVATQRVFYVSSAARRRTAEELFLFLLGVDLVSGTGILPEILLD